LGDPFHLTPALFSHFVERFRWQGAYSGCEKKTILGLSYHAVERRCGGERSVQWRRPMTTRGRWDSENPVLHRTLWSASEAETPDAVEENTGLQLEFDNFRLANASNQKQTAPEFHISSVPSPFC
jgi:hypothetical protein